jgi:hypothetical protein
MMFLRDKGSAQVVKTNAEPSLVVADMTPNSVEKKAPNNLETHTS